MVDVAIVEAVLNMLESVIPEYDRLGVNRGPSGCSRDDALAALAAGAVPAGPIQDAAAILADPHLRARGMFESVTVGGKPLAMPAMAPRLGDTPGKTDWAGPDLGEHTDAILAELGYRADEIARLRGDGAVG